MDEMNTRREFEWFLIGCLLTTTVLLTAPIWIMMWDGRITAPIWIVEVWAFLTKLKGN